MHISTSAYYVWKKRPGQLISAESLHLHRRMKALFKQSRNSLGSREMMKKLREEGFQMGRYKVRNLMKKLKLKVTQRIAYKVTTKRNHSDDVADNLLNHIEYSRKKSVKQTVCDRGYRGKANLMKLKLYYPKSR